MGLMSLTGSEEWSFFSVNTYVHYHSVMCMLTHEPDDSQHALIMFPIVFVFFWTLNDITCLNLNKFPSVTIVDSNEEQIFGVVDYQSANTIVLTFSAAISGKAYLN